MKQRLTKEDRAYLSRLAEIGCIVCIRMGYGQSPAEIHHVRHGQGGSQRSKHIGGTLPLCPKHHRTGGHGVALHAGQKTWEGMYGTEADLLAECIRRLEE